MVSLWSHCAGLAPNELWLPRGATSARHADGVCAEDEMVEVVVDPETEEEAAEQVRVAAPLGSSDAETVSRARTSSAHCP